MGSAYGAGWHLPLAWLALVTLARLYAHIGRPPMQMVGSRHIAAAASVLL